MDSDRAEAYGAPLAGSTSCLLESLTGLEGCNAKLAKRAALRETGYRYGSWSTGKSATIPDLHDAELAIRRYVSVGISKR